MNRPTNTSKTNSNGRKKPGAFKSVSGKLLSILVPLIAVLTIILIMILMQYAKSTILTTVKDSLDNESHYQAASLSDELLPLISHFEGVMSTIEHSDYESDADLLRAIQPTRTYSNLSRSGVYFGLSDKKYYYYDQYDTPGYSPDTDPCYEDTYNPLERDWYKAGLDKEKFTLVGSPYTSHDTGATVITMARKIKLKDGRTGVAGSDIILTSLIDRVSKVKPMNTGSMMLVSGDDILYFRIKKYNNKKLSEITDNELIENLKPILKKAGDSIIYGKNNPTTSIKGEDGSTYYVSPALVKGVGWTVACTVKESTALAEVKIFQRIGYIIMVIAVTIIAIVLLIFIKQFVSKPIKEITAIIHEITQGNFTVSINSNSSDEIGYMSDSLQTFVSHMKDSISSVKTTSDNLALQAENSKRSSDLLSQQASEQSSSMEQIRLAMDGMTDAVSELANNATDLAGEVSDLMVKGDTANNTMSLLVTKAQNGQQDMENVQQGMQDIANSMNEMNDVVSAVNESTQKINSIIEMINSIAEQTNLLSLNASIEAARAGEAGKGFAVVASEIGNLASDSADSTTQIAAIIKDINAQIDQLYEKSKQNVEEIATSSEAVTVAGNTFAEIYDDVQNTNLTIKEMMDMMSNVDNIASSVAAISEEQSASSEEVSSSVEKLATSAEEVAAESEEVADSANTVTESAVGIKESMSVFKID
ncbi:methyl-accepting chemotaxis protein [Lachnobacterium bovis]|uniref:Methyl-accepting chemotaxis protein n=1 Tax=Lachnobacterium bovis TaxID=140626 RepID=A0A1H9SWF8_9FIRM|nr:methyl-accepting chemotaxis protein [Lachnobacterium bovis]SER89228.1 methyl-accepting chemotaxis protein [Lachnobacterium bovis]